jgi:UDP:flavonoid glycosyltransferase YjiC (YdhE family)
MTASSAPPFSTRRRRLKEPLTDGARRRVLFIGEGSTLAHAARPIALASALPADLYEATLVTPERYRRWSPDHLPWRPLQAQTPEAFAERLSAGKPLFSRARLEQYVEEDLGWIRESRAQAVVGDFRLSLAVSARKAGIPYIAISNAYWRPDRPLPLPRPTLRMFRGWPRPIAGLAFRLLQPSALRWHAKPVDELMAAHGLGGIGRNVRRAFTEADLTLYADFPSLFPGTEEDERQGFLGPLSWEPDVAAPDWWDQVPDDRPVAYVTLGSSGDAAMLGRIILWLEKMGFTTLLATAERSDLRGDGRTLFVADYLPGLAACERADLVICNGGSPTTTQALLKGRPALGIASNMDQLLNMRAVQATGAGACLRADALRWGAFESAVNRLSGFRAAKAAAAFAAEARNWDPARVLAQAIDRLTPAVV